MICFPDIRNFIFRNVLRLVFEWLTEVWKLRSEWDLNPRNTLIEVFGLRSITPIQDVIHSRDYIKGWITQYSNFIYFISWWYCMCNMRFWAVWMTWHLSTTGTYIWRRHSFVLQASWQFLCKRRYTKNVRFSSSPASTIFLFKVFFFNFTALIFPHFCIYIFFS